MQQFKFKGIILLKFLVSTYNYLQLYHMGKNKKMQFL